MRRAALPAVHEVLEHPGLAALRATLDHALLDPEALITALADTKRSRA